MVEFFILIAAGLYFLVLRPIWEIGSCIHEGEKRARRDTLVMSKEEEEKMAESLRTKEDRAERFKEIKEELDYVFDGKRYPWMDEQYEWWSDNRFVDHYKLRYFKNICFVLYAAKKYGKYSEALTDCTQRSCIVQDLSKEESDIVLKKMAVTAERLVMEAHPLEPKWAMMFTYPTDKGEFVIRPRLDVAPVGNTKRLTL